MYCIECGSQNLDRAKFCQQCGAEMPAPRKDLPAGEEEAAPPAARPAVPVGLPVESPSAEAKPAEPAPEEEKAAEPLVEGKPAEESPAATKEEAAPAGEGQEQGEPDQPEEREEPPATEQREEPATAEERGEAAPEEEKEPEPPAEPEAPPPSPAAAPPAEVPQAIPVMKITVPPEARPAPPLPPGETTQPTLTQAKVETEATQPTLPQAAARPATWPPKPPKSMKVLGILCIIAGSLNTLINIIVPIIAMLVLWNNRGAELALVAVPVAGLIWLGYSLLLLVGGIGMVRGRLWGRSLCLFFAWTGVLAMIYSILGLGVVEVIINLRGVALPTRVLVVAALFVPALTVVLLMGLLTGRIKRWAEFMAAGPGIIPPARPTPSMPAVFSLLLALALVFPPVLGQIGSIILGFVGLGQIARSKGRKCGRGKAIAGIVISGLTLLLPVVAIVIAIILANIR